MDQIQLPRCLFGTAEETRVVSRLHCTPGKSLGIALGRLFTERTFFQATRECATLSGHHRNSGRAFKAMTGSSTIRPRSGERPGKFKGDVQENQTQRTQLAGAGKEAVMPSPF